MRWTARTLLAMAVAGALAAANAGAGWAAGGQPALTLSLAAVAMVPAPVTLSVGQPALVQVEGHVLAVADAPPGIVHALVRGDTILLIPLREGTTLLTIGLGGTRSARLSITVGTGDGLRLVALRGTRTTSPPPISQVAAGPPTAPTVPTPASSAAPDIGRFVATLTPGQRQAFLEYAASRSLASLSALVQTLNPAQRAMLMDALASPGPASPVTPPSSPAPATSPPLMGAPAARASGAPTHGLTAPSSPTVWTDPDVVVSAPAGLQVHAVATVSSGTLYVSYVIQNDSRAPVFADPHAVEVSGIRGPPTVQQVDVSAAGEIGAGSMETGVIACTPATNHVNVTWRLRDQAGNAVPVGLAVELR